MLVSTHHNVSLGAHHRPIDLARRRHGPPLALAGLALAGWHSGLYAGWIPQFMAPCTKDGPSCSGPAQLILGLPIPYLSLIAFAAILVCLDLSKGKRK